MTPTPPNATWWALIAAFWLMSAAFGFLVPFGAGGHFTLVAAWAVVATLAGVLTKHVTEWTCPECGAELPPPASDPHPAHAHA